MRKLKMAIQIMAITILITIVTPYIKAEYYTWRHYDEFSTLYRSTHMINRIDYFKVINYSRDFAQVYYVSSSRESGHVCTFIPEKGGWKLVVWDPIWGTRGGNADGIPWPYYP